jgi:cell wall-associated NlpC family hydrolase
VLAGFSDSRSRSSWGWRIALALFAFGALAVMLGQSALAEPANITQAREEAEALWARVDELNEQLDAAAEAYNYAAAQLSQTQAAAKATTLQLNQAESDLAVANGQLAVRLVEIYKEGQHGALDALFEAGSLTELMDRWDLLKRVSDQDAELVGEVSTYREDKASLSDQLAQQMEEEQALTSEAAAAKDKVEEQLAANERALADKKDELAALIKAEEERQRKLREQELERQRLLKTLPYRIAALATNYVGCPYVWGAAGPSSFDCSGLAQFVYKQFGISLPHSSAMQAKMGTAVAKSDLRPGDLIFFYSPVHHVAIYIGDGKMVHAAGVGRGVIIATVASHGSYNCARRIVP